MNDKYQDVPEHCGQWRIRNTIPYMNGCKYKWERHDKQGWEFALLLLSIFIVNRFCRSFKKNDESKMSGLFFFTFSINRAICSLWKWYLLFLWEGFAPFWRQIWKLDLYHKFVALLRVGNSLFRSSPFCSCRSLQKERKERFTLLKRAK